ncbi:MAG: invasion associated locus B family protein [Geminicoccaceae bacterium]|nr:DUF1176 domain-containing protein [Geminicoccaceae bacterium]MDW8340144.1 invasion associated locus B family protein [Geminicoccaceae bacterium]
MKLRPSTLRLLCALGALAVWGVPLVPAQAGFVERFRDWSVYVHEDASGRICFVTSEPIKQEGNFARRDRPRLFVTQFGGDRPRQEVSVDPGYTYRKGSTVEVVIDGVRFEFFTDRDRAWARSSEDDARIIAAMRRGNQMTVRGTSIRDTWSLDTYSLAGFNAALKAMVETCSRASRR